jgi:hypothetical protein
VGVCVISGGNSSEKEKVVKKADESAERNGSQPRHDSNQDGEQPEDG